MRWPFPRTLHAKRDRPASRGPRRRRSPTTCSSPSRAASTDCDDNALIDAVAGRGQRRARDDRGRRARARRRSSAATTSCSQIGARPGNALLPHDSGRRRSAACRLRDRRARRASRSSRPRSADRSPGRRRALRRRRRLDRLPRPAGDGPDGLVLARAAQGKVAARPVPRQDRRRRRRRRRRCRTSTRRRRPANEPDVRAPRSRRTRSRPCSAASRCSRPRRRSTWC